MDPVKCLEILMNRGVCGGSHSAHRSHADPTPSQVAAETAATAVGGGQVINLATGSNETHAASEAVSGMVATMTANPSATPAAASSSAAAGPDSNAGQTPAEHPTSAAPCAESRGGSSGGGGGCRSCGGVVSQEGRAGGPDVVEPAAAAAEEMEKMEGGVLKGVEGMSAATLVASFRRAQEERVSLYRTFNGGLKEALRNGDYSGYPALCCEVTAGFSVLSKAINAIEAVLRANTETKPLAGIIRRVQEHEQEKLTVTAAHHLESMREARALGMGPGMSAHPGGGGEAVSSSPGQNRLLKDAVGELFQRAEREAAAVSELLEELRYEAEGLL